MGGARMHCTVSGCGDFLVQSDEEAITLCQRYLTYMPQSFREEPLMADAVEPASTKPIDSLIPEEPAKGYDMRRVVDALVDAGTFMQVKELYAKELITGFARMGGRAVGVLANQPMQKGGVLFVDSADKASRFIWLCDAFNIPLLFLADVPGFMIGTQVERAGIIRHGAKMISAVSEASVPKISVILRKAYGAGLYAMSGPGYDPDATIALPSARIAVMGPEAAVNAVFAKKLDGLSPEDAAARRAELEREYSEDVDIYKLASELIVDHVVEPENLRAELLKRFEFYASRFRVRDERKHAVYPV
jgi:acetyl-CoA carboxylase carboxyltransferase component